MATIEERIAALEAQLAALTAPPTEYYTLAKTGEELDAFLGNSVRFDAAQSLTDAQKAQARENINALGEDLTYIDDCNLGTKSGIYRIDANTKNAPSYVTAGLGHLLIVMAWDVNTLVQIYFAPSHQGEYIRYAFHTSGGISWQPWGCVNPLMQLGVEYRTTERYLGKPVYAQLMNLGNAPAQGSMKTVATPDNSENQQLIWAQLTYYGITFPKYKTDGTLSMWIYVASGSGQFQIYSPGEDRSDNGVIRALVKYTKTTD